MATDSGAVNPNPKLPFSPEVPPAAIKPT